MAITKKAAITLPGGPRVKDTIKRVQWAESVGYSDAWFGDGGAPDALTTAAILGDHSESIRIGIAVTPVFSRTPAVLAATAYTVAEQLPGRFVMGLGSSSHTMMEGWHGQDFEKPLTRVRETAIMVRSMLAGEKSNFDLDILRSHGYRQPPLESPPPIYLAALRPKMIETAAEVGDGVIFNLWPKKALPKMMEHVRIGAEKAGKDPSSIEVVNRFMVCVTDDTERAENVFRASFAPYYATPVYNRFLAWAGYEEEANQIAEGFAEKNRDKTSDALASSLVNDIGIIGTAEECREKVRWAMETGVDTAIIAPLGSSGEEVQSTLDAFAPDNFRI